MQVYCVSVGAKRHHEFMRKHSIAMMHLANSWRNPIDGLKYSVDNGAFHAWANNKPFNEAAFLKTLDRVDSLSRKPEFVVCPDIVAGGLKSLEFSMKWLKERPRDDYYLAVQDGMNIYDVEPIINLFKGLFVGGSMDWKLATGGDWVKLAHKHGLKCHIGRVGTFRRLLWAKRIGADSVDSSTFAQGNPDMRSYQRIIAMTEQSCFDGDCFGNKPIACNGCALPHEVNCSE
jgi:hypothetical protein